MSSSLQTFRLEAAERLAGAGLVLGLAGLVLLPGVGGLAATALALVVAVGVPNLALLVALGALPFHLENRSPGTQGVPASELLILAAALGTTARWLLIRTRRGAGVERSWPALHLPLAPSPFNWPVALFLSSAMLSLVVSEYLRLSLRELRTLILEPVLAYYLLLIWFPGGAMARPLVAFLLGAVGVALVGLVGLPFGLGTTEAEGVRRLQATYPSANHFGLVLGRALPWMVSIGLLVQRWRWWAVTGSGIVALGLLATFSLGAWLGTGAALLVIGWVLGGRRRLPVLGGAVAGIGLLGLVLLRMDRIRSHLEPGRGTTFFRLQVWQSSLAMIRDHPVLGVGLDNFLYLYQQRYILPGAVAEANLSHPHNLVLNFWLQLGLAGLIAGLWLLTRAFAVARGLFLASADPMVRALALGSAASLVDFFVHGLIDNSYFLPDLAVVFWLTIAVLEGLRRQHLAASR